MHIKVILITLLFIFLSGCMSNKIQEKIDEANEINRELEIISKIEEEEDLSISEEQKEIIEQMDNDELIEIVYKNELEKHTEVDIYTPESMNKYTDADQFSQYLGHLFFKYHTKDISYEDYLTAILQHGHVDYINRLPKKYENQLETIETLQQLYIDQLPSSLESYVITDIHYQERSTEAVFYRKYTTVKQEPLYTITIIKKEKDVWKLLDDRPAPPYEVEHLLKVEESNINND